MRTEPRSIKFVVRSQRAVKAWLALVLPACALLATVFPDDASALRAQDSGQPARVDVRLRVRAPIARQTAIARGSSERTSQVLPGDNLTFRPTVVVRRGTSQGSGTIIASIERETLVLTAAHVVKTADPIFVELHRYNVGVERTPAQPGIWPRRLPATLAANDEAADVAILRIEKFGGLPYVARLASDRAELTADSPVTSVGIDLGARLTSWTTRLVKTVPFHLNGSDSERLFLITAHTPEHGRSGGGLFLESGELVGVCIGHAPMFESRSMGIFASHDSIRRLLDHHKPLSALIVRSERRRALVTARSPATKPNPGAKAPQGAAVAPTRSAIELAGDDGS